MRQLLFGAWCMTGPPICLVECITVCRARSSLTVEPPFDPSGRRATSALSRSLSSAHRPQRDLPPDAATHRSLHQCSISVWRNASRDDYICRQRSPPFTTRQARAGFLLEASYGRVGRTTSLVLVQRKHHGVPHSSPRTRWRTRTLSTKPSLH